MSNHRISQLRRALLVLLFAAAPAAAYQFDWGSADVNWSNGDLGPQVFTDVDGSGIDVTVEISGDVGTMVGDSPSLLNVGGELDLRIFPDFADKTQSATITLTFSQPVTIDGFIIRDLDGSTGAWADGVIVTAVQDTSFDGSPNDISAGSLITVIDSNQFEPLTSGSVPYTDSRGWLTTSFNKRSVSSISIIQYPGEVAGADPEPGAITLSEFGFFTDLPLEVTKTADTSGPLNPGDTVNYTISMTNNRTTNEDAVQLRDALPAGMTYQAGSTVVTGFVTQPTAEDDFASGDFSGGSGWNADWSVVNPNGSPLIQVVGGRARFEGVAGGDPYLTRRVSQDLRNADTVLLNFNLDTSGNLDNDGDTDQFEVFVSSNNGNNWDQVASYDDDVSGPQSIDITAFAGRRTVIRFGVSQWVFPANGNTADQYYFVDDVSVLATFPGATATTLDNAAGGAPDLVDGTPPDLVTLADGFYLPAGETLTATFAATVDMPAAMAAINIALANTANYSDPREAISAVPVTSSCAISPEPVPIRADEDDGYWQDRSGSTRAYFSRNYVELGNSGTDAGLRFRGLTIPDGAIVTSAELQMTGFSAGNNGSPQVAIAAQDTANAPLFGLLPPSSLTTASVNWSLGTVSPGATLTSPDLASVFQELVDSYAGLDNAAVALVLGGSGDTNRRISAYGGALDPDNAVLNISWLCGAVDFGDAPLAYGDAGHILPLVPDRYLGLADNPDSESSQLYSSAADGDNLDGSDDENGVSFRSPGGTNKSIFADVDVISTGAATVCGWLDRPDGISGIFDAADGQCTTVTGSGTVTFQWANLPQDVPYTTFARFRISSDALGVNDATGIASDGEVEDYQLQFNFTPTSAVIDNFRVDLVSVAELRALGQDGDAGQDGSGGASGTRPADETGSDDETAYNLEQALAGLDSDAAVAVVQWETLQERGTQGFYLERKARGDKRWQRVNASRMLPGLIVSPLGGEYMLLDVDAVTGEKYRYRLIEQEIWGTSRTYGPWKVQLGETPSTQAANADTRRQRLGRANEDEDSRKAQWGQWRSLKKHYAARPRLADAPRQKRAKANNKRKQRKARNTAALRLRTTSEGLQSVSLAQMAELSGIPQQRLERQLRKGNWQLENNGANVSWFYSSAAQLLYFAAETRRTTESLENVYQLKREAGKPMPAVQGNGPAAVPGSAFREQLHFEENPFLLTYVHSEEEADYGYWDYINTNGRPSASLTIAVPDPAVNGNSGELRVVLRGVFDPVPGDDQSATVALNGIPLAGAVNWDGNSQVVLSAPFEAADLLAGDALDGVVQALVTVTGEAINGAPSSLMLIDRIELDYDRETRARDNQLWLHDSVAGTITVKGIGSPDIKLMEHPAAETARWRQDITVEQSGESSWQASFTSEGGDYLLSAAPITASAETDLPSSLAGRNNGAGYLIIAPRELADSARALATYRNQRFGNTHIAWLQDIYDEFSHGQTDSTAIQAFLKRAHSSWRQAPRYVVMMGRGTLDHADAQGSGDSLIPLRMAATPWGLAPSDNRYADIDGDHVPDFLLGRISVSSDTQAQAYVDKLIAYESAPAGAWTQWAATVADDPDEGGDFHQNADEAATLMADAGLGVESLYHPDVDVSEDLANGIKAGAWSLVNYSGHSAVSILGSYSENFLGSSAVQGMANAPQLPIFAALTCGALDSSYPGRIAIGDTLVNQAGGGSVASFAATGLSLDSLAHQLNLAWLDALLSGESLAEAARRARQQGYDAGLPSYMLDIYSVAGDPAVELKRGE